MSLDGASRHHPEAPAVSFPELVGGNISTTFHQAKNQRVSSDGLMFPYPYPHIPTFDGSYF
jgi:hypothetical protein